MMFGFFELLFELSKPLFDFNIFCPPPVAVLGP